MLNAYTSIVTPLVWWLAAASVLFVAYLGTLMIPLTVTVIPQFILMRAFGWVDSPLAMIVPGLFGSAFGTYLMRQFFRTLPAELEEAAVLDGCTPWQIYWRILLPHAKPAVMVLAVLTWVTSRISRRRRSALAGGPPPAR